MGKHENGTRNGVLNILNELMSFWKAAFARMRGLQKGPEQFLPSVLAAPSGIWQLLEREVEKSISVSGALPSPGSGPCADDVLSTNLLHAVSADDVLSTNLLHAVNPTGVGGRAGQLPDLSFSHTGLCQTTSCSRAAVPTVDSPGSLPAPSNCGFCSLSESKFSPRGARKSR